MFELDKSVCPILGAFATHLYDRVSKFSQDDADKFANLYREGLKGTRVERDPFFPHIPHPLEERRAYAAVRAAVNEVVVREGSPTKAALVHANALTASAPMSRADIPDFVRRLDAIRDAHGLACQACQDLIKANPISQSNPDPRCPIHRCNVTAAACARAAVMALSIDDFVTAAAASADAFFGEAEVCDKSVDIKTLQPRWDACVACFDSMMTEAKPDSPAAMPVEMPKAAPMPVVVANAVPGKVVLLEATVQPTGALNL